MSLAPEKIASRVLAVVLPALVLGGAWLWIGGQEGVKAAREKENVGQVLNGQRLDQSVGEAIDARLNRYQPEILILGNSYANTNVAGLVVAERLGLSKGSVLKLSIPHSNGAHWYAVLKNRVFAKGHRPRVVLTVSDLQSALMTVPVSEASYLNLAPHLLESEPLIQSRIGETNYFWKDLRELRGNARSRVIDRIRNGSSQLVNPQVGTDQIRRYTNRTMEKVFDDSKTDMSLHGTASPVAFAGLALEEDPSKLPTVEDSFLVEIAKLCAEHGSAFVVTRPPMSPLIPEDKGDRVLPGTEAKVQAALEPYGARLWDLRSLPVDDGHFVNLDHMNDSGARRYSETVGELLRTSGVWGGIEHPALDLPPAVSEPVGIPALSAGEQMAWTLGADWSPREGYGIVSVAATGAGGLLRVGANEAPLRRSDSGRWFATLDVASLASGASVVVEASGELRIDAVKLGQGSGARFLVGDEEALSGADVELFTELSVRGHELERGMLDASFSKPPPSVPNASREVRTNAAGLSMMKADRMRFLADSTTSRVTPYAARCSPLIVHEDGKPLPYQHVPCAEVRKRRGGRVCHNDTLMVFVPEDNSAAQNNGRSYELKLDETRQCDGGRWLYPRDEMILDLQPVVSRLRDGVERVVLRLHPAQQGREYDVGVSLVRGDQVLAERSVDRAAMASPVVLELPDRIRAEGGPLTLRVDNRGGVFLMALSARVQGGPGSLSETGE